MRRFNRRSDVVVLAVLGALLAYALLRNVSLSRAQLIFFAVLVPSIILHEVSHGVAALAFGDDTAKRAGRLTLNPVPHIDPFGTIIMPALLILANAPVIGFAKPVPVNPSRMRHPRNDSLIVSLIGPVTNFTLVVLTTLAWHRYRPTGTLGQVVYTASFANVILCVFNLIPIPPLDGSAVLERVMPKSWWPNYLRFRQYSMPIMLLVFLLVPGLFGRILNPALREWQKVFFS